MKNHPDNVKAFIAGWFESVAYMKAHKAESVEILAKVMKVSPEIASRIYDIEMPGCTDDGHFDPKAMQKLVTMLVEPKLGGKKIDATTLYTEAFLPK
jgi:ABC-type nitrate/sulfonate/bicarbonate transport system substrate-binding protein